MSQITKLFDGTVGGDVETLTGNTGGAVGPNAAFNINVVGSGNVTVTGNPGTNTLTITENGFSTATGQTIGAVTDDLITINLGATPTTYTIEGRVAAYEATTPAGSGYNIICVARTTGAAASIIGLQDKYVAEDAAMAGGDADFVAVGNTIILRVLGLAALTINYRATTQQIGV